MLSVGHSETHGQHQGPDDMVPWAKPGLWAVSLPPLGETEFSIFLSGDYANN